MTFDRLRSDLNPLRHDHPPRAWWDVLLWVPVGYAVTRVVGDTLPALAMVLLAVLAAAVHHYAPAAVGAFVGWVSLVASGLSAWDGAGCQSLIGDVGVVVVIVFGSIFVVSSFVRLIGAVSLLEMSRHLLIATASIEISLFLVSPEGRPLIDPGEVYAPAFLLVVLVVVSQIGLIDRMELGMLSLGGMLVAVEVLLALRDNPCGAGGFGPLLGTTVFAGAAYWFATSLPLPEEEKPEVVIDPRVAHGDENRIGAWVDVTPETGVWVDPTPETGVWVDDSPDTGSWLDDDYEEEFLDPELGRDQDPDGSTYDDDAGYDDETYDDDDRRDRG